MTTTTLSQFHADTLTRDLPRWFARALGGLAVEVFALIALGGFVRIMNAGLACPDWPLCFGDYIPDYHPQVYFEFIHRAMAGLVTVTTAVLLLTVWWSSAPRRLKWQMSFAFVLLLAQVVFGALTVLWQLRAGVVATHLGLGTAFFGLLLWMYLSVREPAPRIKTVPAWVSRWSIGVTALFYGQLLLGGLVASHYAGQACTDFPKCQGEWFPTFSGAVGLQVIHRLGAYFIFVLLFTNWQVIRRRARSARISGVARWMFVGVCAQVGLGIANVLLGTPPLIGVLHLATATFLLSLGVRQIFLASAWTR